MVITSQQLRGQSHIAFENMIFDILICLGLQNVIWRTPASDGGKDITGTLVINEFSGTSQIQRWNVECKHLKVSVSWKNIVEKIYFGKNDGVDFVLIATSSTISNQCKDEISKWNKHYNTPQIRYWQGCDILNFINSLDYISHKYFGMGRKYISFFTDKKLISLKKLILAAQSEVISGKEPSSLEAAKSIFELIDDASCDIDLRGQTVIKREYDESDNFYFMNIEGLDLCVIDKYIIKAVSSLIFTYTRCEKIICNATSDNSISISIVNPKYNMTSDMLQFISELAMIKSYCIICDDCNITVRER